MRTSVRDLLHSVHACPRHCQCYKKDDKTCYEHIGFTKDNSYSMKCQKKKGLLSFATKLIEKIPDPSKTKEYYQSYLKEKTKHW